MKNISNVTNFLVGFLGALFCLYAYFGLIPATIKIPQGELTYYQRADIFPRALIIIIFIVSVILIITSLSRKSAVAVVQVIDPSKIIPEIIPVVLVIVCCIVFLLLLPRIGYLAISMLFLGCLLLIYGFRNIILLATLTIAVPIGLFIFFERVLMVFLP